MGDIFSTVEVVQYSGGGSVQWRDNISTSGGITSVLWGITSVLWRVFSTVEGYLQYCGGYSSTCGGIASVLWGIPSVLWRLFSTVGG